MPLAGLNMRRRLYLADLWLKEWQWDLPVPGLAVRRRLWSLPVAGLWRWRRWDYLCHEWRWC